jgi:prepilin-type N-terminal cleavage/methylation domain-containing protein
MRMRMRPSASGFSLVELSIVLVILGLLTGGILTGQSLIRAAELRAITTEVEQFAVAVNTFKGKYFALPGDMNNATAFWGSANGVSCNAGNTTAGTGTQTCNGNADGLIKHSDSNGYNEIYMFWQHLANSGLMSGIYTGMAVEPDGQTTQRVQIGVNGFQSKIGGATYFIETYNWGGSSTRFTYDYVNSLQFGKPESGLRPTDAIITVEEAWNIDKKTDDGQPGRGKLFAMRSECITGSLNTPLTATYNLSGTGARCGLVWISPFN